MRKLCIILSMVWILAGCSSTTAAIIKPLPSEPSTISLFAPSVEEPETELLVSTDSLKVERTGDQTTIYDLVSGETYTFVTKKVMRKKTAPAPVSDILRDTPTLQIKQLKGVLGILVKGTGEFYLV